MFCVKCGNEVAPGERFCVECGTPVEIQNNNITTPMSMNPEQNITTPMSIDQQTTINNNPPIENTTPQVKFNPPRKNSNNDKNTLRGRISWIIGLVSIPLIYVISIFAIPLPIVGLIFGIMAKKKGIVGIIINIIDMIILGVIIGLSVFLLNNFYGTYYCANYQENKTEYQDSDYYITVNINTDTSFSMEYNDANKGMVKGTYSISKYNYEGTYKAHEFTLAMDTNYRYVDGVLNTDSYQTNFTLMTYSGGKEAFLYNPVSNSQYICYK